MRVHCIRYTWFLVQTYSKAWGFLRYHSFINLRTVFWLHRPLNEWFCKCFHFHWYRVNDSLLNYLRYWATDVTYLLLKEILSEYYDRITLHCSALHVSKQTLNGLFSTCFFKAVIQGKIFDLGNKTCCITFLFWLHCQFTVS